MTVWAQHDATLGPSYGPPAGGFVPVNACEKTDENQELTDAAVEAYQTD